MKQGLIWVLALAAALQGLALWLPWVVLRPNRLAAGELLSLPPTLTLLGLLLALLPLLCSRRPSALAWVSVLPLLFGLGVLGLQTSQALVGLGSTEASIARASAAAGFWLWLLGAGISASRSGRLPLAVALLLALGWLLSGQLNHWSVLIEWHNEGPRWWQELGQHLRLVLSALGLALLLGVPLAAHAAERPLLSKAVLGLAGAIQTIPSLALLGLLIAPLAALSSFFPVLREWGISGIGSAPALTAMTLYALLPILQNGIVALQGVPAATLDAAQGMGMTATQRFWRVRLPLALPVWLAGVRQAAVLLVGVAAVAALIGAGGLGTYIFKGLQSAAADLILLGALPAAALAVLIESALRSLERLLGRSFGVQHD